MAKRRLTREQRKRHEEAADWVLRNRDTALADEDLRSFHSWLERDPENRRAYDAAEKALGDAPSAISSDPDLRDFEPEAPRRGKAAAGTVLGIAIVALAFFSLDGPMRMRADVISGVAELPVVDLDDGSTVFMNAGSAIAFDYTDRARTVRLLRGEAYFEVQPDPDRPFSVDVGDTHVTALGTAFDIRRGEGETDVTVTHNAVMIAFAGGEHAPVRLEEGEHVSYSASGGLGEITRQTASAALAWRRGYLVLDNQPLSSVVQELERHFSGRILIVGDGLGDRRVSGTIAVSDTAAALAFLEQALGLKATTMGPLVVLSD